MTRNGHHYTYHLKDERSSVWANRMTSSLREEDYSVLSVGTIWSDESRFKSIVRRFAPRCLADLSAWKYI